jgi:hypothetical protein
MVNLAELKPGRVLSDRLASQFGMRLCFRRPPGGVRISMNEFQIGSNRESRQKQGIADAGAEIFDFFS